MSTHESPTHDNVGRASSRDAWNPSQRERERIALRNQIARKRMLIAGLSSLAVLGGLMAVIVSSPGWKVVNKTFFDWNYGATVLHVVAKGILTNIGLTIVASIAIGVVAMCLALARTSRSAAMTPFRILATGYVDIFRGVPLLLVILLVGFGVPALRIKTIPNSVLLLGTVAVVLTYSAYVAEVIRSGILSVHPSQRAAARSLGLSQSQTLRHVVLPQAIKRVIPPLLNDLVALLKDTGLVSILGVIDAVRAGQIEASRTFNYTPYVIAAILFLIITIPLTRYTDRVLLRSISRQNAEGTA
ncbi:MAG: amino acid ABC transporter permease [Actinomycetes bacterium]